MEKKSFREAASERHLGGIWEASGTPGGHGAPGGSKTEKSIPILARMQSCIKMLILHCVFEGQITKYCKLQPKMLAGSRQQSAGAAKAP